MKRSWSGVGVEFCILEWSWSGVALTRSGVQVELELALFSNSDSTPTDLMTSKRTTKKTSWMPFSKCTGREKNRDIQRKR